MAYPISFRQHVLAYKEKHSLSFNQTSAHFDISIQSLLRWKKEIEPCTNKNRPSIKVCLDRLRMDVERNPDHYQWERAKRFGVTQPAIHDALKRLNLRYKKTLKHPKACEISRNSFVERINEFEKQGKEFTLLQKPSPTF